MRKKFFRAGLNGAESTNLVFAVLMMLVLVIVGIGMIASAQGVSLRELILGNPTVGEKIEYVEGGIYEEEREIDLTLDKQPMTSTLVGCQIAKAIASDFVENGEAKRDAIIGTDSAIVSHAPFQIKWNAEKDSYWKSGDFAERDSDGDRQIDLNELKRACSDTGLLVDCPANLDEACIAAQLKNLRVGTEKITSICTGNGVVIAGGKELKFGDEKCTAKDSWTKCSEQCPGGDRIVSWKAVGGEYDSLSATGVASDVVRTNDKDFKENFPPECKSGAGQTCEPKYEWTVLWNNEEKAYEIEMPRIPQLENLGEISLSNYQGLGYFGSFLASYFNNGDRTNLVGLEQPEMRTVYRATFTPAENYQFNDFVYKDFVQSVSGKGWEIGTPIEYCGACQATSVPIKNYDRKILYTGGEEWSGSKDVSDKWKTTRERRVRLRIGNLDKGVLAANEQLKVDHKYTIIINRYRGPWYRDKLGEENCDFGVTGAWYKNGNFECGDSLQGKDILNRCVREECDGYDYFSPIDYSLTVIDMGPLTKTGEGGEGAQGGSDQGKGQAAEAGTGSG